MIRLERFPEKWAFGLALLGLALAVSILASHLGLLAFGERFVLGLRIGSSSFYLECDS